VLAVGPACCSAYVRIHCLVSGLAHRATGWLVSQQVCLICQQEVDGEVDSDVAGESVIVFDIADEVYSL
jgi:hypothetical protein